MARQIFKYELIQNSGKILVLYGSKILHVGEQNKKLFIWAEHNTLQKAWTNLSYRLISTGQSFDFDINGWYFFKTVQPSNGLVWHLFIKWE